MNIDILRKTFSKAGIAIGSGKCVVIYSLTDRFTHQMFQDETKEFLFNLLQSCDKLCIRLKPGNSIRFTFFINLDEDRVVYFGPTQSDLSSEELEKIINNTKVSDEFIKFISEVNINDEDALWNKMREWIDSLYENDKKIVRDINPLKIYPILERLLMNFSYKQACVIEKMEPNDHQDGNIMVQFPEVFTRPIWICDEEKELLSSAVAESTAVEFEMSPKDGYLNMYFYS